MSWDSPLKMSWDSPMTRQVIYCFCSYNYGFT